MSFVGSGALRDLEFGVGLVSGVRLGRGPRRKQAGVAIPGGLVAVLAAVGVVVLRAAVALNPLGGRWVRPHHGRIQR